MSVLSSIKSLFLAPGRALNRFLAKERASKASPICPRCDGYKPEGEYYCEQCASEERCAP